jgi:hypothetical protein
MENKQNSNRIFETAEPIPEGSHFDKYTKTMITINQLLHQDFETNFPQFEMFLKGIFRDCVRFLTPVSPRLQIRLRLIYNNEEYLALEK